MAFSPKDFGKQIEAGLRKDFNDLVQKLPDFIDERVIRRKFDEGFSGKGHKLQKSTIIRKGNSKVGTDTGALARAATLFTNWALFDANVGTKRIISRKKANGLTAYSSFVATKQGGPIDFLQLESSDIVNMQSFISGFFRARGYRGTGTIRVIIRDT